MKRRFFAVLLVTAGLTLVAYQPAQHAVAATAATPVGGETDGQFVIKFDNSGMCLDDPDFATAPGTALEQWSCNGGANQNFYLDYISGSWFRIRNESSGLCVNIKGDSFTDNTPIILWPCQNVWDETFEFELSPVEQPPYSWNWIQAVNDTSMVLNVNKASTALGAKIILYSISDSTNEFERIIAPPAPPPAPPAPPCTVSDWISTSSWIGEPSYSDWKFAYLGPVGDVEVQYEWGVVSGGENGKIWTGTGPCAGLTIHENRAKSYRLRFIDDDCHCVLTEDSSGWMQIPAGAPTLNGPQFGAHFFGWNPFFNTWFIDDDVYSSPPS